MKNEIERIVTHRRSEILTTVQLNINIIFVIQKLSSKLRETKQTCLFTNNQRYFWFLLFSLLWLFRCIWQRPKDIKATLHHKSFTRGWTRSSWVHQWMSCSLFECHCIINSSVAPLSRPSDNSITYVINNFQQVALYWYTLTRKLNIDGATMYVQNHIIR